MKKKLLFISLLTIFLIVIVSPSAFAATLPAPNPITEGGTYDLDDYGTGTTLVIATTETVTLTQTSTEITDFQIEYSVQGANLIISGIAIDNSSNANKCALSFMGTGNNLIIDTESYLESGENQPGIKVETSTSLTINGDSTEPLYVAGGLDGAGIGGGNGNSAGTITIASGVIYAASEGGAGIGGGYDGDGGTIKISGGYIDSYSYGGAAVGGGEYGDGGNITISGGEIYTYADGGAGIGSGAESTTGGTIEIEDGYIEAKSYGGSGIGGGYGSTGGNITITDGEIYTYAEGGAGIGGGAYGDGGYITITDGYIYSIGGDEGAGIGGGYRGNGGNITIKGGDIIAESYYEGAGIGGGDGDTSETLGSPGDGGTIKISGGFVMAVSDEEGAGIGGGNWGSGGNITISGGDIYAFGCDGASGIGGGDDGDGGTITFSGGLIWAEGDYNDIGSGISGSAATINIEGSAKVFLRYNKSDEVTTSTHSLHTSEEYDGVDAYGCEIPPWWDSGTAYAYINDYAGYKKGDLTGTLTDSDGNPIENYEITIYSDPVTTTTDSNGIFAFSNVSYSTHILTIRDSLGTLIEQYNLYFTQGSSTSTSVSGNDINITYRSFTTSIHLSFESNAAIDDFTFAGATFYGNPQTTEQTWWEWFVSWVSNLFK